MKTKAEQLSIRARAFAGRITARISRASSDVERRVLRAWKAAAPLRASVLRAWEAAAPARKGACYLYDVAVHDRLRMRWRVALAVAALMLAGVVQRVEADTLHVTRVHYNHGSGAVEATVTATGPQNTAIALGLTRGRCPSRPAESEVEPGVTADGRPHQLLANGGANSALWKRAARHAPAGDQAQLCVWTIHDGGAIGARYEERARKHHRAPAPGGAAAPERPALEGTSQPQPPPAIEAASAGEPALQGSASPEGV